MRIEGRGPMGRCSTCCSAALLIVACARPALAEDDSARASEPAVVSAGARRSWDAAIGGVLVQGPEFAGSERRSTRLNPGFYLRRGRLSMATRGGFRSAAEPGERGGFRVDLSPSERSRINLGLRHDGGRIGGNVVFDALGRGGGWQSDVGIGREMRLGADTTWSFGVGLGYAGDRNLQTYFGITEEQAARTGYPVYTPPAGLRDVSASVNARTELADWIGPYWHMFYGASAPRLLGPAADSPLTRKTGAFSVNLGLVYRF